MVEITLVNPDSPFLISSRVMPPLGILYIASSLKAQKIGFHFVDLAGTSSMESKPYIPLTPYYGVTATTPQFPEAVKTLKYIKERDPQAQVCFGGAHATLSPEECLKAGFDTVVVGEGERAIFRFLNGERGIIYGEPMDIDEIPFPDRSLVQDYEYRIDGERATTMMTSRGQCPFRCAFCSRVWKTKLRFRSVENVLREVEEIKGLGYGAVMFYDDELLLNKKRDRELFKGLKAHDIVWRCFTRSNLVDEESVRLMAESGCREVLIGVESGSARILKNVQKDTTPEQNSHAIKLFHKHVIRVKASYIVGLPGESWDTLRETEKFIEENPCEDYDFTLLTVLPGSPIALHPERYDLQFKPSYGWFKGAPNKYECHIRTSSLTSEELVEARNRLEKQFKRW